MTKIYLAKDVEYREVKEREKEAGGEGSMAKGKGKEKETGKGKGKEVAWNKMDGMVRPEFEGWTLRPFPASPKFWTHGVRGSEIGLWPPSLFDSWIEEVGKGKELTLDKPKTFSSSSHVPVDTSSLDRPSHPSSPQASSSKILADPSQPLPSPPQHADDDDDEELWRNMEDITM